MFQIKPQSTSRFIDRPNPLAAALMAKMKMAKMKMAKMKMTKKDRPKVKAECLRLLITLQLEPAKTRLISQFVDT